MTYLATLKPGVGQYGVPGVGAFAPGETRQVPTETAIWLRDQPEFDVTAELPLDDQLFRDETGKPKYLGYYGPIDSRFGYGGGGITILRALTKLGIDVSVNPAYNGEKQYAAAYPVDLPFDAACQLARRTFIPKWEIAQCLPDAYEFNKYSKYRAGFCMWEMTHIPDGSKYSKDAPFGDWAALINKHTERLIVPCQHNAEVFSNCGVRVPITTIPYGLDVELWPYYERPERDIFTVVLFGDLTVRKGPKEAFQAFQTAFGHQDDVRLVLKSQHMHFGLGSNIPMTGDPRVSFINATWTRAQLLQFLHDADCFIWPSRGEGFGLPPLQAALTGLPVVMTTHTGMAEYYDPRYFYRIEAAGKSEAPLYGNWIDPDVDSAAAQLRKVYDNHKAALKKGKQAAAYARKNFSLDAFAGRLGAFLETLE